MRIQDYLMALQLAKEKQMGLQSDGSAKFDDFLNFKL